MESNNNNIEIVLNSPDMTKENKNGEIITPNLDKSNSAVENIENYINEKYD